ncbi:MAG TPA: DUF2520 domain-containing protein [Microbacterium sp.]|nr:DUF2520 domain-containing protein [Microbacterium sp.]
MATTLHPSDFAVATASIVGGGRLGRVLTRALGAAGIGVNGPSGRGERVEPADVVLLCVPDGEIAAVARSLSGSDRLVGHVSGATPLAAFEVDFGLHPLQSFVGDESPDVFHGIGCAVAGRSPESLAVAEELAIRLGARPFPISDEQRAGYHAAASIASNFLVTLMAAAEQVAEVAGIPPADARALLAPLVRSTVENWAAIGPEAALTGPVARGDVLTVRRQRAAVAVGSPDLLELFDALCASALALAEKGRSAA